MRLSGDHPRPRTAAWAVLVAENLALALAYVAGARLGLTVAFANENVTAVWPPTGIAVAALLLRGRRLWPGIAVGAFVTNWSNGLPVHIAAGVAIGNTLAPVLAVVLLERLGMNRCLGRVRDVLTLFSVSSIAMVVSAGIGTAVLVAGGALGATAAPLTWLLWWVGDTVGVVVYAPLLLTLAAIPRTESPILRRPLHAVLLLSAGPLVTVFAMRTDPRIRYLVLPVALWAAMRLEQQGAAVSTVLLSSIAIWHTTHTATPGPATDLDLVLIQGLNATLALTLLSFAAVMNERRRAQEDLRRAAADLEDRVDARTRDLRESEQRLEQAQRLAHIGSFQWDAKTDTNLWTDQLYEIYGLTPDGDPPGYEEYLGFVRPDYRDRARLSVEEAIAASGSVGHEYPIVLRDGSQKWVHAYVDVIHDDEGKLAGLRGTCQDITDRKQAEVALRASEEKLRALLGSAPDAIIVADEHGRIVLVNDQVTNLLGYSTQELIDERVEMLLPEPLKVSHAAERRRYVEDPHRRLMGAGRDLSARHRNGKLVPVDISLSPVRTEAGVLVFASMRDATERRRVEEALRDALERETEAAHYLRRLDTTKNDFLNAVSHELRTPLTTILGYSQLLRTEDFDEATRMDMLERVHSNAERLEKLLGDLLDIDRLHRGIVEPRRRHADLRDLLDSALATLDLRGHPLTINARSADVFVDPAHTERIVENLVSNAVKYTPAGGHIWVEASADGLGGITLVVSDEGPGIPADQREEIFEPFIQGGQDTFKQGTGIGLSLVKRFARLHGGRAWVEDRPGGGSAFYVHMPGAADTHPAVA